MPIKERIFIAQLELIERGLLMDAENLELNVVTNCGEDGLDNNDSIIQKIEEYVEMCKGKMPVDSKVKTKNVVEARKNKIADFQKMCNLKAKKCEVCSSPIRSLRQEEREKFFLRGLQKRKAMAWKSAHDTHMKNQSIAKTVLAAEEGRDQEMEGEESEEEEAEEDDGSQDPTEGVSVSQLTKQTYLSPLVVREHVQQLWDHNRILLGALVGCSVPEQLASAGGDPGPLSRMRRAQEKATPDSVFFLDVIPVPPSRFRPVSRYSDLTKLVIYSESCIAFFFLPTNFN